MSDWDDYDDWSDAQPFDDPDTWDDDTEDESADSSAWEFGTAAAVAGWLRDRQSEQIVAGLQRGQTAAGPPVERSAAPLRGSGWRSRREPQRHSPAHPRHTGM